MLKDMLMLLGVAMIGMALLGSVMVNGSASLGVTWIDQAMAWLAATALPLVLAGSFMSIFAATMNWQYAILGAIAIPAFFMVMGVIVVPTFSVMGVKAW